MYFMSTPLCLLLCTVIFWVLQAGTQTANAEEPFESYPHIRCEGCLAICKHLGENMNESVKVKTSIQSSHRLKKDNRPEREDYETSELRAVELMEKMCNGLYNIYFLRISREGRRYFSSVRADRRSPFYLEKDKEILGAPSKTLRAYCELLLDKYYDEISNAIRKETQLASLQNTLCNQTFNVCNNEDYEKSLAIETKRRKKYIKIRDVRRRKAAAKKKKKQENSSDENTNKEDKTTANNNNPEGTPADVIPTSDTTETELPLPEATATTEKNSYESEL
eukprot:Tbor_TRINITY_DN5184_c2_g1::TRINITY_DN5184_c2_g1_i2::g.25864::m.25864